MKIVKVKFFIWLQECKGFSYRDALDIIKRFSNSKATKLDKELLYDYLNER